MRTVKINAGDWVRFYVAGRLAIGQVQYVRPRRAWERSAAIFTDAGATNVESVLEVRKAAEGGGGWRCVGCGTWVDRDPLTPEGRGHQVPNADGSPGYCGPVEWDGLGPEPEEASDGG